MSDHPLAPALAGLRQLRADTLTDRHGLERDQAGLPALAAATALLAMVLATDARQLASVERLANELGGGTNPHDPDRAILLLSLTTVRQQLGDDQEWGQLTAKLFQEATQQADTADSEVTRAAARLAGSARLWAILASRLDHDLQHATAVDAADAQAIVALRHQGEFALSTALEALASALALLAALTAAPQPPADTAGDRAFEQTLHLAARLAEGRGEEGAG